MSSKPAPDSSRHLDAKSVRLRGAAVVRRLRTEAVRILQRICEIPRIEKQREPRVEAKLAVQIQRDARTDVGLAVRSEVRHDSGARAAIVPVQPDSKSPARVGKAPVSSLIHQGGEGRIRAV